jgi:hypothetical protein
MKLVVGRVVATNVHIVHVQKERDCAWRRVDPRDFWRSLATGRGVFQRDVGAVGEARYRHSQMLLSRSTLPCPSLSRDHHGRYEHDHENRKQSTKSHQLCPSVTRRDFRTRDAN